MNPTPFGETPPQGFDLSQHIGNFTVREQLGKGATATVLLAEHQSLERKVVIKVLRSHLIGDADARARFLEEARLTSEFDDPHIPRVFDVGELPSGAPFFSMEWLPGRTLAAYLDGEPACLPLWRVIHLATGIARALDCAHRRGVVHCDLKPDNVYLTFVDDDPDFVKVLDFGVARSRRTEARAHAGIDPRIGGTPAYMAPEQLSGADNIDGRADVYALGVIVHLLLVGRLPYAGETLGELLLAHLTRSPPSLRSIDPRIPEHVEAAVLQALHKDPALRFATASAFVRALASEAVEPEPASVSVPEPVPVPEPETEEATPRSPRIGIGIACAVAVALLGGWVIIPALRRPQATVVPAPISAPTATKTTAAQPTSPKPETLPDGWSSVDFGQTAKPRAHRPVARPAAVVKSTAPQQPIERPIERPVRSKPNPSDGETLLAYPN